MEIEFGRNNFSTDQLKQYIAVRIDSENARGGILQYSLDNGAFNTLGQATDFHENLLPNYPSQEGHDINYKFVQNDGGDPAAFNGLSTTFKIQELITNESENDYTASGFDKFLSRDGNQSLQGPLDQQAANNSMPFDRTQVTGVIGDTFRTTKASQQGTLEGDIILNGTLTIGNIVIDGANGNITMRDTNTNRIRDITAPTIP
jgi:hypothetical protein